MVRRLLYFPAILMISVAFAGCPRLWGSGLGPNPTRPNPTTARVSQALLALFPQEAGTRWHYEGFAEYAHDMELRSVKRKRDSIVHQISGLVVDVSGGESNRDFRFSLSYVFTRNEVREQIIRADTPFPHRINGLALLRLPLRAGATWRQSVRVGGKTRIVSAQILKVEGQGGVQYTVRYRMPMAGMPGGVYEEERVFRRGAGEVRFENTFGPAPEERFSYRLFRLDPPQRG